MVITVIAIIQLDLRYLVDQIGHRERDLLMNSNNGKFNKNNNKMVVVLHRYLVNLLKKQLCSNNNNNNSSHHKKTHSKRLCLTIQCSLVRSLILHLGHYLGWLN